MQQPEYYSYILDAGHANPFHQQSVPNSSSSSNNANLSASVSGTLAAVSNTVNRQEHQTDNHPSQFPQQQQQLAADSNTLKRASTNNNISCNNNQQFKGNPATTTDFRRRKNWSERILVEISGLLHVLSTAGKFLYCSESTYELTGYRPHELVGQLLLDFIHVDDMDVFIRDFQMAFHTRSKIRTYYRFRRKDDSYVIFEVVGQPQRSNSFTGQQQQQQQQQQQTPTSFFAIAQPVPTKNGGLMDTFLELKAENVWLTKRVNELKQQQKHLSESKTDSQGSDATSIYGHDKNAEQQPAKLRAAHGKETDHYNSKEKGGNGLYETPNDNYMAHVNEWMDKNDLSIDTLETCRQPSPSHLVICANNRVDNSTAVKKGIVSNQHNNAALSLPRSSDNIGGRSMEEKKVQWKRRKKQKRPDEYVCADCGTTSSPEWRKGPQGPKSLCNACGLRWAKRNKQEQI